MRTASRREMYQNPVTKPGLTGPSESRSWHGNKIRFTTTLHSLNDHTHGDWYPAASAVSGTPVEPGEEAAHETHSIFCYSYFEQHPVKNVWPLRSQSVCSQVSEVLFYARTVKFVRAQICVGDMRYH